VSAPIVVGYAHTDASRRALTVAADLALDLGARLCVVHVVDLHDFPIDPDAADWEQRGDAEAAHQRREVETALQAWPGQWSYEVRRGDPVRALAAVAREESARLVVIGTRASSGFAAAVERLLGLGHPVVHGLEEAGDTPVLLVPGHRRGPRRPR
jgi:nucleotide-binding universal stress UspA family protein